MNECHLLIDCGITLRRLTSELAAVGLVPGDIDAVVITHLHSDHISGFPVWYRLTTLRFVLAEAALRKLARSIDEAALGSRLYAFEPGEIYALDGVSFRAFPVSHDAAETVGLAFDCGTTRFVYLTDLGVTSDEHAQICSGSDLLFLEANHERSMVESSAYPEKTKHRILSPRGHLSNRQALDFVTQLRRPPDKVIFGHLSEVNNAPECLWTRIEEFAAQRRCSDIQVARQRRSTSVVF